MYPIRALAGPYMTSTSLHDTAADEALRLKQLRERIDTLDAEIVRLINERASVSSQVGEAKRAGGSDEDQGPFRPERERAVYERILELNAGPLPDDALKAIYREIMSASIALQMPATVSFLGPAGSFTHMAAVSKFGASIQYVPENDIHDVFMAVGQGRSSYGIVPIENSVEGVVNQTIDLFMESRVRVVSEVYVPIHHNFMTLTSEEPIRTIYSHPQGFAQCRRWLVTHQHGIERVEAASTSAAAERAARESGTAAIASEMAARLNGLQIIERSIEDDPHNVTRFFIIGLTPSPAAGDGRDKTSLMFSIKDEPGALCNMLEPFKEEGINLTAIDSRPSKLRAWEYYFFLDLEGHIDEPQVERAVARLERMCRQLQIMGSYPAAERTPMPVPVTAGLAGDA